MLWTREQTEALVCKLLQLKCSSVTESSARAMLTCIAKKAARENKICTYTENSYYHNGVLTRRSFFIKKCVCGSMDIGADGKPIAFLSLEMCTNINEEGRFVAYYTLPVYERKNE